MRGEWTIPPNRRTMHANSRSSLFACALLALATTAQAQLSFGGKPLGLEPGYHLPEAPVIVLPAVDVDALMAEDLVLQAEGKARPYRFGYNHGVDLGLENSGLWSMLPNGDRVWRLGLTCPGAFSINFEFHDYFVPEGAQVFVYNEDHEVLGGFEAGSNPGNTSLGVAPLAGDHVTVEYVEPLEVRGQGSLRIGQVTHAYRDIMKSGDDLFDSGACNNNVICPVGDPWRDQIASVAMIVLGGSGLCTGQLINNCNDDGTPYFLTANHCLGNPQNWVFRFNWESPTCNTTTNAPTNKTVSGAALLAHGTVSDYALLQLNTPPPESYNVYHTGWNRSILPASSVTVVHHPQGDIKKISLSTQPVVHDSLDNIDSWLVSAWNDGTTEIGSSGSGLWDQNGLLVGQLYGGQASCQFNFNDYFGRFNTSYPFLEPWLGTCGDTHAGYRAPFIGIEENLDRNVLIVSPNPTSGIVTLTMPERRSSHARITVFNALGSIVQEEYLVGPSRNPTLDLASLPPAQYIIRVTTPEYTTMQRVVLAR